MFVTKTRRGLLAALALTFLGCATSRVPALRAQHLAKRLDRYEYTQSLSDVWPLAEQVLFSRGLKFRTLNSGGDSRTLETEDQPVADAEGLVARYLVQGLQGPERCRIIVTRRTAGGSAEPQTERDPELELAILQQVDTRAASLIFLEAQRAAEAEEQSRRR